ncbi:MAG: beta-N-acetylhexosaminidase [Pseudomonadota bacterium]|nr:beta-N-acetylhexosaminidase [Pseudomonadota bacterium]
MRAFVCGVAGARLLAEERAFLRETQPWGLILFKRNVESREQLRALTSEFRAAVGRHAPVLIDQEGGRVQRLGPPLWSAYPAAARFEAELGGARAEEAVRLTMRLIAQDLREVGVDVDCAPVLDVADEATHAVIGTRAYARDPARVASLGRAAMAGLMAGGVAPVVKHIPGHGRARADSHLELPVVAASRAELERDFAAFRALSDAPAAMTAHVVYSAIDPTAPCTTSAKMIGEIVRGEIGFDGLLFSDDLSMKALGGAFEARARAAFAAGVDIALHCNGDLNEARPVADASPPLAGRALARAEAMMASAAAVDDFDVAAGRAKLATLFPAA